MAVLVIAAARLAFHRGPLPRPSAHDVRALAVMIGALTVMTACQALDLFAVEAMRLVVAGLAAVGATFALSRGPWPGEATGSALAALLVPVAGWALVVSRTRNAWLGALVGLSVIGPE